GPLPIGQSGEHASIAITDPSSRPAKVRIEVSSLAASSAPLESARADHEVTRLVVGPGSERLYDLSRGTGAGFAAVSVVSSGAAVGVAEIVSGRGAPLESGCDLGTAVSSVIAAGSTLGGSFTRLSIFDPSSTPAVAAVEIGGGRAPNDPAALQGVTVPASGLAVVDLGHFAVQQASTPVVVKALSGRIVVGELGHLDYGKGGMGDFLTVGAGTRKGRWTFPPGPLGPGRSIAIEAFNPATRPAGVSVTLPFSGHPAVRVAEQVLPGVVATIQVPIPPGYLGTRVAKAVGPNNVSATRAAAKAPHGTAHRPTSKAPQVVLAGALTIESTTPLAVSRLSTLSLPHSQPEISVTGPPSGPSPVWVLCGGTSQPGLGDSVLVADTSSHVVQVTIYEIAAALGAGLSSSKVQTAGSEGEQSVLSFSVLPDSSEAVPVGGDVADVPAVAFEVESSRQVVVEQIFTPDGTRAAHARSDRGVTQEGAPAVSAAAGIPATS
ncbi:MAG: hypothetical protein ACRDZ5_08955, partial [Acidimicrobiales bacterium]